MPTNRIAPLTSGDAETLNLEPGAKGAHHERGCILKPVRVGICGLGTVGGGTFNVLTRNADDIARRAGRPIVIEQVAHRSIHPDCDITGINATTDVFEVG